MSISSSQRHTKAHRCPICDGADGDPRGQSKRCSGFTTQDNYAHCSREEFAGGLSPNGNGLYAHKLFGNCKCGTSHGPDNVTPMRDVATYDYKDENGVLRFQVVRYEPKEFRQRRPDGSGGWIWSMTGVDRLPYRLPELVADDSDRPVYVVEGEKDVDTLTNRGHTATCNPGGAGKWASVEEPAKKVLAGRTVIVVADADEVGRKHAADVATRLAGVAKVQTMEPPSPHKDVTDLLRAGGTLADLVPMRGKESPDEPSEPSEDLLDGPALALDDPELEYIIAALGMTAGSGAPHMFAGYGFSGKTMLAQALALAIAADRPAWGGLQVMPGRVLHVDLEQGKRLTKRRYKRLAYANGIHLPELGDRLVVAARPTLRLIPDHYDRWVKLMTGRTLCVIDSWRAACPNVDENSSEVRASLDMLGALSEVTGCRALVIHHARKPQDGEGGGGSRFTIRGSSGFYDGCDAIYVFSAQKGEPVKISCEKAREHGETVDDVIVEIQDVPGEHGDKSGVALRLFGAERIEFIRKERDAAVEAAAVRAMRPKVVEAITRAHAAGVPFSSAEEIRAGVHGKKPTVTAAIREAMEAGEIHRGVSGSKKNAFLPGKGGPQE